MRLVLLQLGPLPPGLWTALPGREFLLSAPLSQETWRPWSLTPSTTINAASSLIVPVVTLYLVSAMPQRSEEHTSELQSLMRTSYAVFCLKKKHIQLEDQGDKLSTTIYMTHTPSDKVTTCTTHPQAPR